MFRDREPKDDREREEPRETVTNGEDRKGDFDLPSHIKPQLADTQTVVARDSPPPQHDELDTAE